MTNQVVGMGRTSTQTHRPMNGSVHLQSTSEREKTDVSLVLSSLPFLLLIKRQRKEVRICDDYILLWGQGFPDESFHVGVRQDTTLAILLDGLRVQVLHDVLSSPCAYLWTDHPLLNMW